MKAISFRKGSGESVGGWRRRHARGGAVAAIILMAAAGSAPATITVAGPAGGGVPTVSHWCPDGAGGLADFCQTDLMPLARLGAPGTNSTFARTMNTAYAGWDVTLGDSSLGGTINVTTYDAHLCDPVVGGYTAGDPLLRRPSSDVHCVHGAEIVMSYTLGPNDWRVIPPGAELRWIQMGTDTGDWCLHNGGTYIDHRGAGPFYWTEGDMANLRARGRVSTWFYDAPQDGCATWGLNCGLGCPLPGGDFWSIRFETYLAVTVPGSTAMTVYEGVRWGFDAGCTTFVPAPGSVATLAGLLFAFPRRRRAG